LISNRDIKSTGEGHFAVINEGPASSSYDLLVNKVGGYDGYGGTVPVKPGVLGQALGQPFPAGLTLTEPSCPLSPCL
jgi:hypothetical protein